MEFHEYIIRRLIAMLATFIGILTLVFVIARIIPGDPAHAIAGRRTTGEQLQAIREEYNLNAPIHEQYVQYIIDVVIHQDLGMSFTTQRPVTTELIARFPATFELTTVAVIIAVSIGIPLGVISAVGKDGLLDHLSRGFAIGGVSVPSFWLAILSQMLFYYYLGWLPSGRRLPRHISSPPHVTGMYLVDSLLALDFGTFVAAGTHLFLPAVVLSTGTLAQTTRITRSAMIDVLNEDYITWSEAHGFKPKVMFLRHALKNAIMPTITAIGLSYGLLLGGTVVIEIVFNFRGMGLFLYEAVLGRDFNAIVGVTMMFAMGYLIANFLVDIIHMRMNPEIEVSG